MWRRDGWGENRVAAFIHIPKKEHKGIYDYMARVVRTREEVAKILEDFVGPKASKQFGSMLGSFAHQDVRGWRCG